MNFEIQPFQLITILVYATLAYAFWKLENKNYKIGIVVFAFILFVANPIRFKQESFAKTEKFKKAPVVLQERVNTDEKSFEERQEEQLKNLKNQSKDIKDEIDN